MREKLKGTYDTLKKWFWALPLWKRSIVSSLIGAFGGSSIIAFMNEYALYYYAICRGIRVPVEGVEYLSLAVSLLSFAFILISTIGSAIIYQVLSKSAIYFNRLVVQKTTQSGEATTWPGQLLALTTASAITLLFTYALADFFTQLVPVLKKTIFIFYLVIPFSFFIAFVLVIVPLIVDDNRRQLVTVAIVLLIIISCTFMLFNQTTYSYFLERIKYGGGIEIRVEYRKADNTEDIVEGGLLIRTRDYISLEKEGTSEIAEIPIERVSKIVMINR